MNISELNRVLCGDFVRVSEKDGEWIGIFLWYNIDRRTGGGVEVEIKDEYGNYITLNRIKNLTLIEDPEDIDKDLRERLDAVF